MMLSGLSLLFLVGSRLYAGEIVESFSARDQYAAGSLIWNQATQEVHPPIQIQGFAVTPNPLSDRDLDVGHGEDGSFEPATYSRFGSVVGNNIYLGADKSELKVTRFELAEGYHLYTTGNEPLIIRSLSDVLVHGVIHCEGESGQDNSVANPQGGIGRCGGGRGGDGGALLSNGGPGTRENMSVGIGMGGLGGVTGGGGGGAGGAFSNQVEIDGLRGGANDGGLGGISGSNTADHAFTVIGGAAGGGGGGGGTLNLGGAGGGGGGAVVIFSRGNFELGSQGLILAQGGNGGAASGDGGAGAPGGGGSVLVFSAGNIRIDNANGGSPAISAVAGSQGLAQLSGDSGVASFGRIWMGDLDGVFDGAGYYFPTEDLDLTPGEVGFAVGTFSLESQSYDLRSTLPELENFVPDNLDPGVVLSVSGSSDNFLISDTGFQSLLNISQLQLLRYLKFRLEITNTDTDSPLLVKSVSFQYRPGLKETFAFSSQGGCGSVLTGRGPSLSDLQSGEVNSLFLFSVLLLCLPLLVLFGLKAQSKT